MIKKMITLLLVPLTLLAVSTPAYALIDKTTLKSEACNAIDTDTSGSATNACTDPGNQNGIAGIVSTVINILSVVIGIAAIIVIMLSGLRYITSGGESSKTASAKNALVYAVIGLVVAALAQVIVHVVLNRAVASTEQCQYNSSISAADAACKAPAKK